MLETIKQRTSIRNYEKKPLTNQDLRLVMEILSQANQKIGPFGHQAKFFYTENQKGNNKQYGTYGFIKHAPAFIGGVITNTIEAMVDFGYLFEEVILQLTAINLGTVWLGGTFKRSEFDIEMNESDIIAAISPVGYPKNKSMREKVIRSLIKADQRIDFNKLFFWGEKLEQLPSNHPYHPYLEAVQIGPSASNKQPWRVIIDKDMFHVYIKRNAGYGNQLNFDIQAIDIGIALVHLDLTLQEDHYKTTFITQKPFDFDGLDYITSIRIKAQPRD